MSKNLNTLASIAARQAAVEKRLDGQDAKLDSILEAIQGRKPATTKAPQATVTSIATPKATRQAAKARKAKVAKAVGPKALTMKNRVEFVRENPQFAGQSTRAIAQALIDGASFEGNWTVGPRRMEMLTGVPSAPVSKKAAKKGKKAKATVVAAVKPEVKAKATRAPEPEYGTAAWIAWARPTDDGAPRRANGTAAPKSEWALRMRLEATGKHDRFEVDAKVAKAAKKAAKGESASEAERLAAAGFTPAQVAVILGASALD